jgi:lysophospholipase L1-like esterase
MILFLGDSFTWGQGLYYEKWKNEGINVHHWLAKNGEVFEFPHEHLDYESHQYRKENHFPSLVAKYYDKNYDVKWGNGGSNWDIIIQSNMIPIFSPQFRDGLDLVVIQLTDWTRTDNESVFRKNFYKDSIVDTNLLLINKNWEDELIDDLFEEEALYQLKKIKEHLDYLDKKWIVLSWHEDMGNLIKEYFPDNYVPIYYENKEWSYFDLITRNSKYTLREFSDSHFNSIGHQIIADSIIRKIESMGGQKLFTYPKYPNELFINKQVI